MSSRGILSPDWVEGFRFCAESRRDIFSFGGAVALADSHERMRAELRERDYALTEALDRLRAIQMLLAESGEPMP